MSHGIRWSALVVGLFAVVSPLEAQKGKGVAATPQEYQQVLSAGEITGKIARIDHSKRILTVALEIQTVQQGGGNQNNNLQNLARQQQQMVRQAQRGNQNPAQQARQIQQQAAQMQRQQIQALTRNNGGAKTQTIKKEFEFQADEKAKVRLMSLPQEFDERGKPKQYTAAELKELKGPNASLPGYQADFENLSVGDTVKVTVSGAKKATVAKPAKPKDKDADVDNRDMVALDPTKYRATMVLILRDETAPAKGDPKKKK